MHIKSRYIICILCVADLIFGSHGFFAVLIIVGYGMYRLYKCPECKEPDVLEQHPIPRQPNDMQPGPFTVGPDSVTAGEGGQTTVTTQT
jgi:hypothetical protein